MTSNITGATASNLDYPNSVFVQGTRIFVPDRNNNRVLIWNSIPTAMPAPKANIVVGQGNLTTGTFSAISATTLDEPTSVYSDGTKLFIADGLGDRIVVWNTIPTAVPAPAANLVFGQPNFTTQTQNTGGLSASGLNYPSSIYGDATRLYVSDGDNNRTLIWNTIPAASWISPNLEYGQPGMGSNSANDAASATNLNLPETAYTDGTRIYVADFGNNRILIWNSIPTSNQAPANIVIGQPNMTVNASGLTASTLNGPTSVFTDGTRFYSAESTNNRVLIWNAIPNTSGVAANIVVGQPNMTSFYNPSVSSSSLSGPLSVFSDGTRLYVADQNNSRILIWNSIPTTNPAPGANVVIGQQNMTANGAGTTASTLVGRHPSSAMGQRYTSPTAKVIVF